MYLIPICDDVTKPLQTYHLDPDSNCKDMFNTKLFRIAKFEDPLFLSYNKDELRQEVKSILQIQGYLLFQWCVIRMRIEPRWKYKKLHFSYSRVMPWNFFVTSSDIELYLKQPRFLWRFSVNNYGYFLSQFGKEKDKCRFLNTSCDTLVTYDQDSSEIVSPYNHHSLLKHYQKGSKNDLKTYSKDCKILKYKKLLKGADLYKLYSYEESEWMFTSEYLELAKNHRLVTYHEFLDYLMLSKKTTPV